MTMDYRTLLEEKFIELGEKLAARDGLDLEIAKLHQFVRATLRMLPDQEQDAFERRLDQYEFRSVGLTDAVRNALRSAPEDAWTTGPALRQRLIESGFDFTGYTSNPLASIHAIAKRFKPSEVKTQIIDGVRAFRWVGPRASFEGRYRGKPKEGYRGKGKFDRD
jgi:hypothetical protein